MPLPKDRIVDAGARGTAEPLIPDAEPGEVLILARGGRISWAKVYSETRYWSDLKWTLIAEHANVADNLWITSGVESIGPDTASVTDVEYNEYWYAVIGWRP